MKLHIGNKIVQNGLCISCGICKAVCPKQAIRFIKKDGMYLPFVDEEKCCGCGKCIKCCSGAERYDFVNGRNDMVGHTVGVFSAYAVQDSIRECGSSGGCITALLNTLLGSYYDYGFVVKEHRYDKLLKTVKVRKADASSQQSRYVPVSHENLVRYMLSHKNERLVIVATGCVMHALQRVIDMYGLSRDNYFMIGLFCDKLLNYHIADYVVNFVKIRPDNLIFRCKERIGWPGEIKIYQNDGKCEYLSNARRGEVKDFFTVERCLYCADKFSINADMAIGDNYTASKNKKGSNSIIVRTKKGKEVLDLLQQQNIWNVRNVSLQKLLDSQVIWLRYQNLWNAVFLKERKSIALYPNMKVNFNGRKEAERKYNYELVKTRLGKCYSKFKKIFCVLIKLIK